MPLPNAAALAANAERAVRLAGDLVREHNRKPRKITLKGRIDLVTETDLAVEALLKKELKDLVPGAEFLAEESAESLELADTCWVIDPVDGTTNFAHGLPLVGISVALLHKGKALLGFVNAPLLDEFYSAVRGQGAFCNGLPLSVAETDDTEQALVATGFPYAIEEELEPLIGRMRRILPKTRGLRRCGVASIDLAWVARGRFDAFYENRLKPWDIAAGALLVEEAGGRVSAFNGLPLRLSEGEVLASNGRVHEGISRLLLG